MKTKYVSKTFRADALAVIEQANSIIEEYQADGKNLSFASRDHSGFAFIKSSVLKLIFCNNTITFKNVKFFHTIFSHKI